MAKDTANYAKQHERNQLEASPDLRGCDLEQHEPMVLGSAQRRMPDDSGNEPASAVRIDKRQHERSNDCTYETLPEDVLCKERRHLFPITVFSKARVAKPLHVQAKEHSAQGRAEGYRNAGSCCRG